MAVFIYFQALGPYIQLIYQPYIYCTIRHCHWYILYKIGQWQEFESACYYRARTVFFVFWDRFFLGQVFSRASMSCMSKKEKKTKGDNKQIKNTFANQRIVKYSTLIVVDGVVMDQT